VFIILLIEIESTEEINSKNIDKFILTNLKLQNIDFQRDSKIIYTYISNLSLYQLILYNDACPEFLYFKSLHTNEVFINKDYVVVYKNNKFFYYQKIENNILASNVVTFLKQRLQLDDLHVTNVNEASIDKNKKYNIIKPIKTYSFRYFIIYFFILLFIFSSFNFNIKKEKTDFNNIKRSAANLKKQLLFYSISEELKKIYTFANITENKIVQIILTNSKIKIETESKNKKNIYTFFNKLDKNSIENIFYNKEKGLFYGDAIYEINRR